MKAAIVRGGNRLRRSFNLWVVLILFFVTGTGLVAVNAVLMFGMARGSVGELCGVAVQAYRESGADALRLVLRGASVGPGIGVHILDSNGYDLLTGLSYTPASSLFASRFGTYSCVVDPPPMPIPILLGPMLWVLPFVSVLCCTLGGYVRWRMRKIEAVVRSFGSGQLHVRVPSESNDAIGRLAAAFNQMAERIQSLVAAHQRLCADIAHELRSPLTRLLLAIPRARGGIGSAIDRIELEAYGISSLVDELLEVARAVADPEALQTECVDLGWLLAEIADDCAIEAENRGCEIQLTPARYGKVMGDGELLRRAFENVLRNAVRYTPKNSRVLVHGDEDAYFAVITIRDFGPGVSEYALEEIFKPFYRVDSGRERATGEVGLGLSIAQRLIAAHKGTISAENCTPGLCVTIRLPRK